MFVPMRFIRRIPFLVFSGTYSDWLCIHDQRRIQEFILGGAKPSFQPKVEGEARIEGAKRPRIEGEARFEGAKRLRIEGEARTEGEAREKTGGRGLGRGLGELLPRKFLKNRT